MSEGQNSQESQDMFSPWEKRFNRHGWPTMILVIAGLLCWRASSWIEPKASRLIDENIKTFEVFRENVVKQTEAIHDINNKLGTQQELLKEVHTSITRK